ncbi:uncharacterized protein LOC120210120 [Hibiscus syriacus]|uniref:uncharacterized protein LOC120210120 n=1 Tax=Hibiscus syriacus TaxID=106335 RepID=UPI001924A7E2|nr:uncharacterized protein LOC120210120 [Hibiscus syriacus]XP_039064857.1 uncharacterized protein LOC120210120 [Hibiscus syriacus]XP_039064858.1 uncharacterized protein LOC120210120 [Hibiscus syriacus]
MNSSDTTMLDFNHPLFMHLFDTSGSVIVSHRLVGIDNYNIWSRSMKIALLTKNKLGFVDGSCCKEDYDEFLHSRWERCNAFVLSWIFNTMSSDLSARIVFASSAAHAWTDLKERFDKVDGSRIFSCIGKLQLFLKKLLQFLMGLKDTYSAIHSKVLLMQPVPIVNQTYSMIVQEEAQRVQLSGVSGVTAMYSSASENSDLRCFNGVCDFYKIKGHKRGSCYRLNGFAPDFKFTKKKVPQATLATNTSLPDSDRESRSSDSSNTHVAPVFTTAQYNQILELLNKSPSIDTTVNLAESLHWEDGGIGRESRGLYVFNSKNLVSGH